MPSRTLLDRFMSKVVWNGDEDECWEWQAHRRSSGYGEFWLDGKKRYAHRVAYEFLAGPIPDGLQIDHLCRNRACVNPAHLEPVTRQENLDRGIRPQSEPHTHCKRGHPLTPDNIYRLKSGGKCCRKCKIRSSREWRERRQAA